ncbi:hypothetical protein PIB30_091962, partial [Stylosanthes scabra]|nr:hypothetical protein [Stylosanthes scabra]
MATTCSTSSPTATRQCIVEEVACSTSSPSATRHKEEEKQATGTLGQAWCATLQTLAR